VIRPFREEDAEGVAALLREDEVPHALTAAGVGHWLASQPERARAACWVAEEDGEVAGWVRARLSWATSEVGVSDIWAFVRPSSRRRGLGAALYDIAREHLVRVGGAVLESWTTGRAGDRFLRVRGFEPTRRREILLLDVAAADLSGLSVLEEARRAEGYELLPLAALVDRVEALHALDAVALADVPTTHAEDDVRLDDWLTEVLSHPQLSHEGSRVVVAGETPVAYAFVHVDPEARMAANDMTGTHPDHRRRGLARLAKLGTIAWAREHGFEAVRTDTDEENPGMLHLNRSLGYRPIGVETQYQREDLR
jgi:GNAT superfamily N-acetyltransferase